MRDLISWVCSRRFEGKLDLSRFESIVSLKSGAKNQQRRVGDAGWSLEKLDERACNFKMAVGDFSGEAVAVTLVARSTSGKYFCRETGTFFATDAGFPVLSCNCTPRPVRDEDPAEGCAVGTRRLIVLNASTVNNCLDERRHGQSGV